MVTRFQERLVPLALLAVLAAGTNLSGQSLPASDDTARARLNASPRHGEWVKVESGGDTINAWVVYPERSDPAPVVLVIHEIYGLTDWIRSVADQLAAEGYIAIAPDILTGKGPGGGGTESVDRDGAVALVRALDRGEVVVRLNAVAKFATSLPAAQDKWASLGFCWGGSTSFAYAAAQPNLSAAVVYYGSSPSAEALARIQGPVLALYGGDDARVNKTIPAAQTEMKRLGKSYQPKIYEGAGHGFLRAQEARDGANMRTSEQAWPETIGFLRKELGR